MAKRGKTSLAELTTPRADLITPHQRPDAPYELTDKQADVWIRVANDLPADWFTPKNFDLLKAYCRHVVNADRVALLIEAELEKGVEIEIANYDKLLAMQEREGRAMSSLATRMRTTQQSLYDKKLKLDAHQIKKPWE